MFKIALFAAFILFSFLACGYDVQAPQNLTGSNLTASDPYFWDFGMVEPGKILKHNFLFVNNLPKGISIVGVDTSCGCTASEVKKRTLAPGESTEVEVSFNSTGYSGEVKQYVYVRTDNPEKVITTFVIRAEVIK